ncbi:uncharacterized protein N7500_004758 [Penicillium coprophilum]|uniref:uncharacterized protein n=1 Tax=Penicillium coprophilum TaxID=36646 RepID=UPI00239A103A|nr:uncharacterized protein N7500_004758 [Penicillium coprophilum]KAJ5162928.1 hypothetical protein N7500_004758 [Penicillium coprophilum]
MTPEWIDFHASSDILLRTDPTSSSLDIEVKTQFSFNITITRDVDDPQRQPCIIHWDPIEDGFGQPGMLLLRYNYPHSSDLQRLQPDLEQLGAKSLHPREVNTSDPCFRQLNPGDSVSWEVTLPSVYFDMFQTGKSYNVFWAGGQIPLWDWGTLAEHSNHKLGPKSPAAILPSGLGHKIDVPTEESDIDDVGPLSPSPEPILAPARMSGAPIFSLSIAGPTTLSMKDHTQEGRLRHSVTATLSYDTAPDAYDGMPVTFHTFKFEGCDRRDDGFRLYFQQKEKDDWSPHELGGLFTHHAYRFSTTVPVNVGRDPNGEFVALMPGESWSFTREVSDFPQNVALGDRFRYGFKGAFIDWWDWGNLHDHEDTVVLVNGRAKSQDNECRPKLVVPVSNFVEFELVE